MRSSDPGGALATLTHARLRARQGDYAAAAALLRQILEHDPEHAEARELLRSIDGRGDTTGDEPAAEEAPAPPEPGDPDRLAGSFRRALAPKAAPPRRRIRRLEGWLRKIRRDR
jgi:hypothetical protein